MSISPVTHSGSQLVGVLSVCLSVCWAGRSSAGCPPRPLIDDRPIPIRSCISHTNPTKNKPRHTSFGTEYTDAKSLRYGHLMIMTDQDHDGQSSQRA
jgi:hypothetical protein